MVPEAPLQPTEAGVVPAGEGWFVLSAREAKWMQGPFGAYTRFEGEQRFAQLGINIGVLEPGQPACMYHGEESQEDFLVLHGECLLIIEGEQRRLQAWDFVHCPPWTEHVFLGAGDGPCTILAVGARPSVGTIYPFNDVARRHGAGVAETTPEPAVAYAEFAEDEPVRCRPEWLPS